MSRWDEGDYFADGVVWRVGDTVKVRDSVEDYVATIERFGADASFGRDVVVKRLDEVVLRVRADQLTRIEDLPDISIVEEVDSVWVPAIWETVTYRSDISETAFPVVVLDIDSRNGHVEVDDTFGKQFVTSLSKLRPIVPEAILDAGEESVPFDEALATIPDVPSEDAQEALGVLEGLTETDEGTYLIEYSVKRPDGVWISVRIESNSEAWAHSKMRAAR